MKPSRDRVVAAPLEQVSLKLQDSLKARDMPVKVVNGDNGAVRIESAVLAKKDVKFSVMLSEVKTGYGDRTKLQVEGAGRADPKVQQLLTDLELSLGKKTTT